MSNQEWRVLDGDGNEQGPYSFVDLQSYYTSGNITHETMIWTEGLAEWVPAGNVEGLLPDIPQIVPLAPAPVVAAAPMAQPVAAGGINLSPQNMGATSAPAGQKQKNGAPTWITVFTILSGIAALVLFFFPWVSMSGDVSDTAEKNIEKLMTQTGMQSITQKETMTDEMITMISEQFDISKDKIEEEIEEEKKASKEDSVIPNYEKSTLNLIAIIAIGIGVVLGLIGFLNQGKSPILVAQILFVTAAILISTQMAMQFPIVTKFIEEQEKAQEIIKGVTTEMTKARDAMIKTRDEMANTAVSMTEKRIASAENSGDKEEEEAAKLRKEADENIEVITKQINDINEKTRDSSQTAFEPSCFITIGLLGCSLLLLVVTMASGDSSTIMIPQPVGQLPPTGQPQQPQQPGGGLKFH